MNLLCPTLYTVRCYQPGSDISVGGVIGPLATDVELEDVMENMTCDTNMKIISIERLKRKVLGKLEDSLSLKILFEGRELPSSIKIFGMFFRVRPYVPSPVQCYNCQRYGHTAGSCKTSIRCLLCSGNHKKEQCTAKTFFCANCKEQHIANSKDCKYMKMAKEVELVKIQERVPHSEARILVGSRFEAQNGGEYQSNDYNKTSNYANISKSNNSQDTPLFSQVVVGCLKKDTGSSRSLLAGRVEPSIRSSKPKEFRSVETQTCEDTSGLKAGFTPDEEFLKNLRNFIIDICSINLSQESAPSKIGLADSAIRNNFGIDLRENNPKNVKANSDNGARKRKFNSQNSVVEDSTIEEDVLSGEEDEDGDLFLTVEKRQVRMTTRNATRETMKDQKTTEPVKKRKKKKKKR